MEYFSSTTFISGCFQLEMFASKFLELVDSLSLDSANKA